MADFTPELQRANLQGYTGQGAFKFWCQMALPIVYDDSLSYYELLNKVVAYLNNTISDVATAETNIENINDTVDHNMDALLTAYNLLQGYVNDYFDNLDVQVEINNKLDEMATSGALTDLLAPLIPELVTNWLTAHVNPVGSAVVVDNSLTVSGAAADAKTTGNKIANVNTEATAVNNTIGTQFRGSNLTPTSTNANFWLNVYGGNSQHEGYEVLRYPVTPGTTIFIRVSDSEAPAKWVFKTTDSGVVTNIVGDIHLYGGQWAVTVPDTANYLFIARQTGDTDSYAATTNFGKGHIINPCVFVYISGGKLQVECTSTARAILDNNVMNISGWSTSLDYNANSTDAVIMTSSGFVLKRADKTSWGDCIIAYCYGAAYTVVSVDRYVFANAIPIDNLRKRAGVPFFVNKKRIKQYGVLTNQNYTKITDFGYFYRFNDGAIGTEPLRYATPDGNSVRNTNTLTANSANIANKTILCIGDSITRRGWFQDQLKTRVSSLNFVGTQTTYFGELGNIDGKYKCEGYSGRTAKNVLVDSTILLQDGTTIIPNPFYNPSTQSIDYGYYCTQQGVAPDYVIIEFGLNEDQPKQYSTAIQGFINSVKSYAPNTVVYVIQPFNAVDSDIGSANSNSEQHEIQCELCVLESRSFTNCVLIPCWYIMVDEFDYVLTESPYGYDDKMVTQFEDGVHPGLQNRGTTGFKKLGDQIYNYLGITS